MKQDTIIPSLIHLEIVTSHCSFAHIIASGLSEMANCATPEHFLSIFQNKLIFDDSFSFSHSATNQMLQRPNLKISLVEGYISEAFIQTSTLRPNMFDNELSDPVWQLEQLLQVLPHPPKHTGASHMDHLQQGPCSKWWEGWWRKHFSHYIMILQVLSEPTAER